MTLAAQQPESLYLGSEAYRLGESLGAGHEAEVFALPERPNTAVKIFHRPLSAAAVQKLDYQIRLGWEVPEVTVAWPKERVTRDRNGSQVIGYAMPRIDSAEDLAAIFTRSGRRRIFGRDNWSDLLQLAQQLLEQVMVIHQAGFLLADVNPRMVKLDKGRKLYFVDCNGWQINHKNHQFNGGVFVKPYQPPEILRPQNYSLWRTAESEYFSLAILIFQIVFLGKHPFVAHNSSCNNNGLENSIANLVFPYQLGESEARPPPHSLTANDIDSELFEMFLRIFTPPSQPQDRPGPEHWLAKIKQQVSRLKICPESQHSYSSNLTNCPFCKFDKGLKSHKIGRYANLQTVFDLPSREFNLCTKLLLQAFNIESWLDIGFFSIQRLDFLDRDQIMRLWQWRNQQRRN